MSYHIVGFVLSILTVLLVWYGHRKLIAYQRRNKVPTAFDLWKEERTKVLKDRKAQCKAEAKTFKGYKLLELQAAINERVEWNIEVDEEDVWILPNTDCIQNFSKFISLFEAEFPGEDFDVDIECYGDIECYIPIENNPTTHLIIIFTNDRRMACQVSVDIKGRTTTNYYNNLALADLIPKIKEYLNK